MSPARFAAHGRADRSVPVLSALLWLWILVVPGIAVAAPVDDALEVVLAPADAASVRFTVINRSAEALELLVRDTPLDPLVAADLFEVTAPSRGWPAGVRLPWVGPVAKRLPVGRADVRTLAPGAALSATVRIDAGYAVPADGVYRVEWRGTLAIAPAGTTGTAAVDDSRARTNGEGALAGFVRVRPESGAVRLRLRAAYAPASARLRPGEYQNCSARERADIREAAGIAEGWTAESVAGLATLTEAERSLSPRYALWFGEYDAGRFDIVSTGIGAIGDTLANERIGYVCGCTQAGVFAYVNPLRPYEITLCPVFWQTTPDGRDSRAGTIVHELSHFRAVAATQDHAYGQGPSRRLALASPELAVRNADSYGYFVENRPDVAIDSDEAFASEDDPSGDAPGQGDPGETPFAALGVGETVSGELRIGERALYRVQGATSLGLESLEGDADLAVYADPGFATLSCRSERVEPLDECDVAPGSVAWVEVFGYSAARYRLSAFGPGAGGAADAGAQADPGADVAASDASTQGGDAGPDAGGGVPLLGTLAAGDRVQGIVEAAQIVAWRLADGGVVELESIEGDADLYVHAVPPPGEPLSEATLVCQAFGDSAAGATLDRCRVPVGSPHYLLVTGFTDARYTLSTQTAVEVSGSPGEDLATEQAGAVLTVDDDVDAFAVRDPDAAESAPQGSGGAAGDDGDESEGAGQGAGQGVEGGADQGADQGAGGGEGGGGSGGLLLLGLVAFHGVLRRCGSRNRAGATMAGSSIVRDPLTA